MKLNKLLLVGLIAVGAGTAASAETVIKVTIAAGHPPVARWVKHTSKTFIPAVDKALEGSGYRIEWKEQYAGTLAKVGGVLEAVEEGIAEVGLVSSLFEQSKLSIQNVTYYTPFVSPHAAQISDLVDSLHFTEEAMRSTWEANGLVYLGGAIGIDDYLLMTNFPVKSIDDLKGHQIAAPGAAATWLSGTGAVAVGGNLTTYYNNIKNHTYDGTIVFASAALPFKLYEVAPYITKVHFGAQYAGGLAANVDWFESQPEVVQKALMDAGVAYRAAYNKDLDEAVANALKVMASKGAKITELDEATRKKWAAGMDNAAKVWATKLDSQGQPGTKILKIYMESMRAAGAKPLRDWDKE